MHEDNKYIYMMIKKAKTAKTYPTITACRIDFSIAMISLGFIKRTHFNMLSIHPYVMAKTFANFMEKYRENR